MKMPPRKAMTLARRIRPPTARARASRVSNCIFANAMGQLETDHEIGFGRISVFERVKGG
jgi:hypothetical protein